MNIYDDYNKYIIENEESRARLTVCAVNYTLADVNILKFAEGGGKRDTECNQER